MQNKACEIPVLSVIGASVNNRTAVKKPDALIADSS